MQHYISAYVGAAITFLVIDVLWLSYFARDFYWNRLGDLLLDRPNLSAAALFYLVYLIGVVIFAIAPAIKEGSFVPALIYGALFGFFAYATYDMTNFATLKNWPVEVVVVDVLWGTFLTATAACAGYATQKLLSAVL